MNLSKIPTDQLLAELARRVRADGSLAMGELPLEGTAADAAKWITAHPGQKGQVIADAIGTSHDNFRRVFNRTLKPRGFRNIRGCIGGHYAPNCGPIVAL